MLRDFDVGTVNIFHSTSFNTKSMCTSALAIELFPFIDGFRIGFTIRHSLERMLSLKFGLTIYTDSHSLYGLCISLTQTTERRLQIDLALIGEAYERREMTDILSVESKQNAADNFIKPDKQAGILPKVEQNDHFMPMFKSWAKPDDQRESTSDNSIEANIQK